MRTTKTKRRHISHHSLVLYVQNIGWRPSQKQQVYCFAFLVAFLAAGFLALVAFLAAGFLAVFLAGAFFAGAFLVVDFLAVVFFFVVVFCKVVRTR